MISSESENPIEAAQAVSIMQRCLGRSVLAIYLHGSAVAGGLQSSSDVDLLAIIDRSMTADIRKRLVVELMSVSGRHPVDPACRRPVELVIFRQSDLAASVYPARSDFVYGEWLRDAFEAGETAMPVADPELTLMLAQARQEARPLFGPEPTELLPPVPQATMCRAIADALPALLDTLDGDERNVLLTLARMWRTLATGEFVPKDVAAEWAMQRLSGEPAAVLAQAREAYLDLRADEWRVRQQEVRQAVDELSDRVTAML